MGWSQDPGPPQTGNFPVIFFGEVKITSKLSVLIDESGDLDLKSKHAPYYIFTLLFHEQGNTIKEDVEALDDYLGRQHKNLTLIHTGPLIRSGVRIV